jgi:diguanylate cyclase (GGDEF)-like protein
MAIRNIFRRIGFRGAIIWLTGISILGSVGLTYLVTTLLGAPAEAIGYTLAIVVPAIIAPVFSYIVVGLIFQLDAAEERLRALSIKDDITQAYNRRYFIELAEREWECARRYGGEFAIVLFDLDDFKHINDTYGHLAGDQVLRTVCEVCLGACRAADTFARFGGDEFIFLTPHSEQVDLPAFVERLRARLGETVVRFDGREIRFTVSLGASRYDRRMPEFEAILVQADQALYRAKARGGNCAELAEGFNPVSSERRD